MADLQFDLFFIDFVMSLGYYCF